MPKKSLEQTCLTSVLRCLWLLGMVQPALATLRIRAVPGTWRSITITLESWYHMSLIVESPDGSRTVAELYKNDSNYGLRVDAGRCSGSVEVVLHLDVGDTIGVRATKRVGLNSLLVVTQVPFNTSRSGRPATGQPAEALVFGLTLTKRGWRNKFFSTNLESGFYWVSVTLQIEHPDVQEGAVRIGGRQLLFRVYANMNCSVTAAAAVYMTKAMLTVHVPSHLPFVGLFTYLTIMDLAQLKDGVKPYLPLVAWTGFLDQNPTPIQQGRLSLSKTLVDQGRIYEWRTRTVTLPRTGFYMVSLRLVPPRGMTTVVKLYQNRLAIFKVFAERGVPTGSTHVLWLEQGDMLFASPDPSYSTIVREGTLMSVIYFSM